MSVISEDDVEQFVRDGCVVVRVGAAVSRAPGLVPAYLDAIAAYRRAVSAFFASPRAWKEQIRSPTALEAGRFYPGYWPPGVYDDTVEGVEFPVEYLFSRDYEAATVVSMFPVVPPAEGSPTLPHEEVRLLCGFWTEHVLAPLRAGLERHHGLAGPACSLQLVGTHYPADCMVDWHRDKGFVVGIMGPESGLAFKRPGSDEPVEAALAAGDFLLYTGLQFAEHFAPSGRGAPAATPHRVVAGAGRMSIVLNAFNLTAAPRGFPREKA